MARKKSKKDDDEKAKKARKEQEEFYKKHPPKTSESLIIKATDIDVLNSLGYPIGYITNIMIKESSTVKWYKNLWGKVFGRNQKVTLNPFDLRFDRLITEDKLYDIYIGGYILFPGRDSTEQAILSVRDRVFPNSNDSGVGIKFGRTGEEWWFTNPTIDKAYHGLNFDIRELQKNGYVPMDTVVCRGCIMTRHIPTYNYSDTRRLNRDEHQLQMESLNKVEKITT